MLGRLTAIGSPETSEPRPAQKVKFTEEARVFGEATGLPGGARFGQTRKLGL